MTMSIRQLYLRSLPGLYIVQGLIWNCQVCPRRIRHLLFLFKKLMKLKTNIHIALQFRPMGQKTMTGLDVAQLLIIYLLNKGYQVMLPFLLLKLQQLTWRWTQLLRVMMIILLSFQIHSQYFYHCTIRN